MIKHQTTTELLGLDKFTIDEDEPHILLDKAICAACADKPCTLVCPAGLYTVKNDILAFDCAGCLECGTCRLICPSKGIVSWKYPRGSFGIVFRLG